MKPSSQTVRSRNQRHSHQTKTYLYATITACCCFLFSYAAAFSPPSGILRCRTINSDFSLQQNHVQTIKTSTRLYNLDDDGDDDGDGDGDDDGADEFDYSGFDPSVADQIRKAKQLINESKKKQKSQEEAAAKAAEEGTVEEDQAAASSAATLPFFANQSLTASAAENARKIKSTTETGEIIADGDTMASLSISEPWEVRSLTQMFEKENHVDYDGNETDGDNGKWANRDVASSIYNLRKKLQTEDFRKVFDSKNWFIGDLD